MKKNILLILICAAFCLALLISYGHQTGKFFRPRPNFPKSFEANLSQLHQYTNEKLMSTFILARMISKFASDHLSSKYREAIVSYKITTTELCSSLSALNKREMKFEYPESI